MKKVVLITGSTDGIGKQTAIELAKMGYAVLIHGRNIERIKNVVSEIKSKYKTNVDGFVSDFNSLSDVKKFANEIKNRFEKIDVLINNAGVYMNKKVLTKDGFETTFQVNHLSHFLLTNLLIELIKKSDDGRIINVSSIAHQNAQLDWDNLNAEKFYEPYYAYALSKLANILFTKELNDKIKGMNVTTYSLHPGVISTKLLMQGFNITGESLEKGAATSVYLAISENIKKYSGEYFIDKKVSPSLRLTYDKNVYSKFWDVSFEMVKKHLN
ncbi:MAG: SDR family oxidoreductase [Melioribacteraceae bacterium]|nr:SDR family oxidoreductase [Melioribacteraceae bacterium]